MSGFCLEVLYVDGRKESYDFGGEKITVGSAEDATVQVHGVDKLAPHHCLLVAAEKGVWVSTARDIEMPVACNGVKIENIVVPWRTELDIGPLTLRVLEPTTVREARAKQQKTVMQMMGLALVALAAVYLLQEHHTAPPPQPVEAPELFPSGSVSCELSGKAALGRAKEIYRAAGSYMERYAFDSQDGIRAVLSYDKARACFAAGGDVARSEQATAAYDEVKMRIQDDYLNTRVRLKRALDTKSYREAKRYIAQLSNLVQHKPGEYFDWLRNVWNYVKKRS